MKETSELDYSRREPEQFSKHIPAEDNLNIGKSRGLQFSI